MVLLEMSCKAAANLTFGIETILQDSQKNSGYTSGIGSTVFEFPTSYCDIFSDYRRHLPSVSAMPVTPTKIATSKSETTKEIPRRIGHPYQSRAPPKHKKLRTSFTKQQIALLEARFEEQKYLASDERSVLASKLQMSDSQVKTWFQNRRTKWRRQEAEEKECVEKASVRFIYSQCVYLNPEYRNNEETHS